MFVLHIVYTARINFALNEFTGMFNNNRFSTERNATPNQLWSNGTATSTPVLKNQEIIRKLIAERLMDIFIFPQEDQF